MVPPAQAAQSPWKATILVVEDEPDQVRLYHKALGQYRVLSVATASEALDECGLKETVRAIHSLERAEMIRTSGLERQFAERLARHQQILTRLRGSRTHCRPGPPIRRVRGGGAPQCAA